jgi:hypothetical protein
LRGIDAVHAPIDMNIHQDQIGIFTPDKKQGLLRRAGNSSHLVTEL